ncbi:MAG: hypothetical protein WCP30_15420, partial [Mycobacteriaceae bacterium]
ATIIGTDLQKNSDALTTSSNNWALITDPGSKLISGELQVGNVSSGNSLMIRNGATVSSTLSTSIGISGFNNSITVDGAGSSLTNTGSLIVGTYSQSYDSFANSLRVTSGGSVASGSATIGNTTSSFGNSVTVSGSGSLWTNDGDVILGNGGSSNSLVIANGGGVVSSSFFISYTNTSSDNSVLVTGSSGISSTLNNMGALSIGYAGSGSLTVADGALVVASGGITLASQAGSFGRLNIGSFGGTDTAGAITAPTIVFGAGTGAINFNQVNAVTIPANISDNGNGAINQLGSGTTILNGNNSSFSGLANVNAGILLANSSTALGTSMVTVANSGTLGGNGSIGGAAAITSGGTLTPGYYGVGSLSFTNGLTLQAGSTTLFRLNSGNSFTSINLPGENVRYGGELVFNIAGYTPSAQDVFTVFNMTGGATASGNFSSIQVGGTFLSDASGIWSGTDPLGVRYQFSDATGQLIVIPPGPVFGPLAPIPTLSERSLIALLMMLSISGVIALRRQRR